MKLLPAGLLVPTGSVPFQEGIFRHYKIFCVNVKYGIHYGFRIFLFNSFAK